jgi:predicted HTH transcriptional regulator
VGKKTSTKSTKTVGKKTSTKNKKTVGKKTREKSHAESLEHLEIKGEMTKTRGKKTVGKNTKTRGKKTSTKNSETSRKKTSTKRAKTSRKNWGLSDEELVVLRLTSNRVVEAMRRNPSITREELVSELRVTLSGVNWQIAKLRKDKIIRRVGGRKFGHWEVLI